MHGIVNRRSSHAGCCMCAWVDWSFQGIRRFPIFPWRHSKGSVPAILGVPEVVPLPGLVSPRCEVWNMGAPEPAMRPALHLRLASTERDKHAEGEQFACGHVDARATVMITEAVGREMALDVLLVSGSRGVVFLRRPCR
jgi:hypothetical protein